MVGTYYVVLVETSFEPIPASRRSYPLHLGACLMSTVPIHLGIV